MLNATEPVNALVADSQLVGNLPGAPLKPQVESHIGPDLGIHTAGIAAALGSLRRLATGLFSAIATQPSATAQFAADGAAVSAQQAGDLADGLFGFQEAVNLVSFFLAEVLVHWVTSTWRLKRP